MIISLAGVLLAAIAVIVSWAMVRTFAQYGEGAMRLGRELAECRTFIEMRVTQRPTTPLRGLVSPKPTVPRARSAEPGGLRAAA